MFRMEMADKCMRGKLLFQYRFPSCCRSSDKYLGGGTRREILHRTGAALIALHPDCCSGMSPVSTPLRCQFLLSPGHAQQRIATPLFSTLWEPAWSTKRNETPPLLLSFCFYYRHPPPHTHSQLALILCPHLALCFVNVTSGLMVNC